MTFGISMGGFFAEASATIAAIRVSLSLPPLLPSGAIVIGQEWLSFEHNAPRIVAVPTRTEYRGALQSDTAANAGGTPPAKYVFSRDMYFDIHCWGNPDPAGVDQLYGFNSTIELEREFLYAIQASGTIPVTVPQSGEWRQPQDIQMRGRLLVFGIKIWTPVTAPPYTVLPYSVTPQDGGVAREITVQINPPGGDTVGPIVIPI